MSEQARKRFSRRCSRGRGCERLVCFAPDVGIWTLACMEQTVNSGLHPGTTGTRPTSDCRTWIWSALPACRRRRTHARRWPPASCRCCRHCQRQSSTEWGAASATSCRCVVTEGAHAAACASTISGESPHPAETCLHLQMLSTNTRRTKVVELSSGTHRYACKESWEWLGPKQ